MNTVELMREALQAPPTEAQKYNTEQVEQQSKQQEIANKLSRELWIKSAYTQDLIQTLMNQSMQNANKATELAIKADPSNDNLIRSLLQQSATINQTVNYIVIAQK